MRYASPALISYLESASSAQPLMMADLYTIALSNGTTYNWTDADTLLTYRGTNYTAAIDQGAQPLIERGEISQKRGLDVSTLDVTLYTQDTAKILGVNANLAANNGSFDLASVLVQRVVMPTWGDTSTLGGTILFEGFVGSVDVTSTSIILHVSSYLQLLTNQMPRTLFIPSCANTFGDSSCGYNLALVTTTGTAQAGSSATTIATQSNGYAVNALLNGTITFTSGLNTGIVSAIQSNGSNSVTIVQPLPSVPQVGDAYTIIGGCQKTMGACQGYFGNLAHFRGCPFVPSAETAVP
jgi:uncharacterized phage protein (TIGR02218 family)